MTMGNTLMSIIAIAALVKRKESPIEPFKRTAQLVDGEVEQALRDLECSAQTLVEVVKEKIDNDRNS
jgi:hypothetical protein